MKFTCQTSSLNKAIQTVQRAISSKPTAPIFSGIHIIAVENILYVQAMDLNMAISCTVESQTETNGEIVVSAKHFAELMRKLPGETVTISKNKEEKTITVQSAKSDFQLLLMNEDDYPKFPEFNPDKQIMLEDEKIKELIKKTIFSCSTDEARPLFTGILVEIGEGKITFVGTNTHRLAIKSMPYSEGEEMSIIIPARVLSEIARNLNSDLPQEIKISLLNNQIMVVIDQVIIVSRLIEGKFPDYRRVIPPAFNTKTRFNVKELAGAVERVALFSSDGDYSIIKVSVGDTEIVVSSSSPDVGKGRENIQCRTEGDTLNVAFNSKYILDILKNLSDEEAVMELNNSLSPVCIKPVGEENYLYIVTPVRVVF